MATVVLGVAGGIIGGAVGHGNLLAIQKGWAIGTTLGGFIDATNRPSVRSEVGKLTDLRYSGSNYGAAIPKFWGKVSVAGNIIWVANYLNNNTLVPSGTANATHLIEHKEKVGGGGGGSGGSSGGGGSSYWYSASYAVAFGEASSFLDDGSFSNRNPVIKKIWANDVLIYDADNPSNNKVTIRFHYGGESETVDSLILQAEGTGNAPAYRGLVYVVIQDHNLKPYGSQIPNIRAEIHTDVVNLGDIASDVFGQVNLYGDKIDVSLATALVKGYVVNNRGSAQSLVEPLLSAFATDAVDIDGQLKLVPRGGSVVASISELDGDLGAVNEGDSPIVFHKKMGVRSELPGRVDITYFDIDKNYQQVTQTDIKQSADFYNPVQLSLTISMSANDARKLCARTIDTSYLEADPITLTLSHKYRYLTPTDVLDITFAQYSWDSGRFRVVNVHETPTGNISVSVVKDEPSSLTQVVSGSGGTGGGGVNNTVPVPCTFYCWSGLELREEDRENCGVYVAATWPSNGQGGACYYSTDSGTTWIYSGYIGTRTQFGSATTALANGSGFNTWDNTNTVDITITNDGISTLQGTTQDGVLNGTNIAMLGGELIGFVTTQLLAAYSYRLSNNRRGMRNSPYTGHTNTDKFVVVTPAVLRIPLANSYAGSSVRVKVVAPGQTIADVTHQTVTVVARNPGDIETRLNAIDSPKNPNLVYSGPTSGSPAQPTFRALTNADLPDVATLTIKGRVTAGTGDSEDLTGSQVNTILPTFGSTTNGIVPAPNPAGTTRFLREDGTWVVPSGGGGGQASIQFRDEGSALGTAGTVDEIDFTGTGVTASRTTNKITVNIPSSTTSPGGSNTQIQFNASGAFSGNADFTWDNSGKNLYVNGSGYFGLTANSSYRLAAYKQETTNLGGSVWTLFAHQSLTGGVQNGVAFPSAARFREDVSSGTNQVGYAAAVQALAQITNSQSTGVVNNLYGAEFSVRQNTNQAGASIGNIIGGAFVVTADSSSNQGTITNLYGGQFLAGLPHGSSSTVTSRVVGGYFRITVPSAMLTGSAFGASLQLENPSIPAGGANFPGHASHIRLEDFNFTINSGNRYPIFFVSTASDASRAGIWWGSDSNNVALFRSANNTVGSNKSLSAAQRITSGVVTLTDAATIALDASLGNHFKVTLGGNRTLGIPTNAVDGQKIMIEVIQDGTGSRTLTLTTGSSGAFAFGTDITGITLSTTANATDFIGCVYSSSAQRWRVIAFVKGY